jgi:hypothetical protein
MQSVDARNGLCAMVASCENDTMTVIVDDFRPYKHPDALREAMGAIEEGLHVLELAFCGSAVT